MYLPEVINIPFSEMSASLERLSCTAISGQQISDEEIEMYRKAAMKTEVAVREFRQPYFAQIFYEEFFNPASEVFAMIMEMK